MDKVKDTSPKNVQILIMTGFMQVFFITANTYMIAQKNYIGVAICGFLISWIWSYNVKKVAIGGKLDRVYYSLGAMVGGLVGLFIAAYIS